MKQISEQEWDEIQEELEWFRAFKKACDETVPKMEAENKRLRQAVDYAIEAIQTQGGLVGYHSVILDRIKAMRDESAGMEAHR